VNRFKVTNLKDDLTRTGFIGLQVYGVGSQVEMLKVQWWNLHLRELPAGGKAKESK
jgi:hypothetical protein